MDKEKILAACNKASENTLMQTLEIKYVDVGEDFLTAKMPVTKAVHQPDGILHGGATAALAESVGSAASFVFLDTQNYSIRGLEISANHLKSVREGDIYATARFIHKGRTTQLFEIKVTDEEGKLISICKLSTIAIKKV